MMQNENESPNSPGAPDSFGDPELSFFPSGGIDGQGRSGSDAGGSRGSYPGAANSPGRPETRSAGRERGAAAGASHQTKQQTVRARPVDPETKNSQSAGHDAARLAGAAALNAVGFAKRFADWILPVLLALGGGLRRHAGKLAALALVGLTLFGGLYAVSGFLPESWRNQINSILAILGPGEAINLDEIHIKVIKLKKSDVVPELSALGTIEYYEKVSISSKTAGRIESISVKAGDRVRKGQTLVQIERLPLELELRKQKAALAAAESQLKLAREEYLRARSSVEGRVKEIEKRETTVRDLQSSLKKTQFTYEGKKTLFAEGGISREEFETVRQELVSAEASYLSAKKDLEISRIGFRPEDLKKRGIPLPNDSAGRVAAYADLNTLTEKASVEVAESRVNAAREDLYSTRRLLDEMTIISPIAGVVAVRNKSVGEEVNGGSADSAEQAILVLIEDDRVYATINVRESDLKNITVGQKISFGVDVYPEEEFAATVQIIKPLIDQQTHTAEVKGVVDNRDHRLRSGMFIRARVATGASEERILVPADALIPRNENKAWVFVVREDKAYRVEVVTGRQFGENIEIVEGLEEGSVIAVEKLSQLYQGATITPDYTHL
ncbi:MAG: efflux RND transporter periplasmic adaptor subunit [Leptospirales bacterium]|jgi:HlyD family secretion protein